LHFLPDYVSNPSLLPQHKTRGGGPDQSQTGLPNLQTVRIKEGGTVKKATVCTRCIRTGNFEKAV
jgi:hypothetical protein